MIFSKMKWNFFSYETEDLLSALSITLNQSKKKSVFYKKNNNWRKYKKEVK